MEQRLFKKKQEDAEDGQRLPIYRGHSGCCEGDGLWVKGDVGKRGSREGSEEVGVQARDYRGSVWAGAVGVVRGRGMENNFWR